MSVTEDSKYDTDDSNYSSVVKSFTDAKDLSDLNDLEDAKDAWDTSGMENENFVEECEFMKDEMFKILTRYYRVKGVRRKIVFNISLNFIANNSAMCNVVTRYTLSNSREVIVYAIAWVYGDKLTRYYDTYLVSDDDSNIEVKFAKKVTKMMAFQYAKHYICEKVWDV